MIRRAELSKDKDAVIRLIRQELLPYVQRAFPQRIVTMRELNKRIQGGVMFVSTMPFGSPNGFVLVRKYPAAVYIDMLAVDSNVQGFGIGSALMDVAEQYGTDRGVESAALFVDEHNYKAQHFYRRRGYTLVNYNSDIKCYLFSKPLQVND